MKISIVIPVYNEVDHLETCLQAIADQSQAPFEVIVVDNNSTDGSAALAARFPFVTVVHEKRQGVVYARGRGFDAARGDIIGRIDADTIVSSNWVATLELLFANPAVDALSGAVSYYDLPWRSTLSRLDLTFRQWIATGMGQEVFLYGSNMALRRTSWKQVRRQVCLQGGLHEDFDLAIHLQATGARVVFDQRLRAAVSLRRCNVAFKDFLHYAWLSSHTYRSHGRHAHRRMYPVVVMIVLFYPLIQLLYRFYDPRTGTVAITNLYNKRSALRVNPATYVD